MYLSKVEYSLKIAPYTCFFFLLNFNMLVSCNDFGHSFRSTLGRANCNVFDYSFKSTLGRANYNSNSFHSFGWAIHNVSDLLFRSTDCSILDYSFATPLSSFNNIWTTNYNTFGCSFRSAHTGAKCNFFGYSFRSAFGRAIAKRTIISAISTTNKSAMWEWDWRDTNLFL